MKNRISKKLKKGKLEIFQMDNQFMQQFKVLKDLLREAMTAYKTLMSEFENQSEQVREVDLKKYCKLLAEKLLTQQPSSFTDDDMLKSPHPLDIIKAIEGVDTSEDKILPDHLIATYFFLFRGALPIEEDTVDPGSIKDQNKELHIGFIQKGVCEVLREHDFPSQLLTTLTMAANYLYIPDISEAQASFFSHVIINDALNPTVEPENAPERSRSPSPNPGNKDNSNV